MIFVRRESNVNDRVTRHTILRVEEAHLTKYLLLYWPICAQFQWKTEKLRPMSLIVEGGGRLWNLRQVWILKS